jgi:hypothetical protein
MPFKKIKPADAPIFCFFPELQPLRAGLRTEQKARAHRRQAFDKPPHPATESLPKPAYRSADFGDSDEY